MITTILKKIIEKARQLGLPEKDLRFSFELLQNNEYSLCLDIIITQFYELSIPIDNYTYNLISHAASGMKINDVEYSFLKELIK